MTDPSVLIIVSVHRVFNFLLSLCGEKIHSKIISSLCIKIHVGGILEGNMARMQLNLDPPVPHVPSIIFFNQS